jgi:hypothetical protein
MADEPPSTKPDNKRPQPRPVPGIPGLEIAPTDVLKRHPAAERSTPPERSISPFPQQQAPTVIVEQAPPARRSFFPRELPGWVGKAAAALFAAVVLPITLAVTRRIDAGTAEVAARTELVRRQAETEAAKGAAVKAELTEFNLLSQRVSAVEALRGEVADLRSAIESTHANVAEITPATRPPKKLRVRPSD